MKVKSGKVSFVLILALSVFFVSCPSFSYSENELEWLAANINDSFELKGSAEPPERFYPKTDSTTKYSYKNFFSKNLNKNIIVQRTSYLDSSSYFRTNYIFLEHESEIKERLQSFVSPDFSDSDSFFDLEWCFSTYDEDLKFDYWLTINSWQPGFILIHASETELNELETRLKSLAYNLSENSNFYSNFKILITSPSSTEIDFSTLTYETLYTDSDLLEKFYKKYSLSNGLLTEL